METFAQTRLHRRDFHGLATALPAPLPLAALHGRTTGIAFAQSPVEVADLLLVPTPEYGDADDLASTPTQTAGPLYTPETPERQSLLEPGMAGTRFVVTGHVYDNACQPLSGALLDFWQADDSGIYGNEGYRLRGHQFADDQGRFELETIVPGLYPGRTCHVHVHAQAPNQPVPTTQLYFPDEPANAADGIFNPDLVMDVQDWEDGRLTFFTFVVNEG